MKCEHCGANIKQKYGSGRFCSEKCARIYSSIFNLEQTNKKRSNTLLEYYKTHDNPATGTKWSLSQRKKYTNTIKNLNIINIEKSINNWNPNMDKKRTRKLMFYLYGKKCQKCGLDWVNKKGDGPYQIHHIDGNKKNNEKKNLQILCLNCHWKTDNFGFKGRKHKKESIEKGLSSKRIRTHASENMEIA